MKLRTIPVKAKPKEGDLKEERKFAWWPKKVGDKLIESMRHKEPQSTLCWTAWHIFDRLFSAKYETGKLTMNEYCQLINIAIARRQAHISNHRKWYEFRLRWKDRVFFRRCQRLLTILQPAKPTKQKTWGTKPLNTSKNAVA